MAIMVSIPTFQTLIHFLLLSGYNLCPLTWSPRSLCCIPYLSLTSSLPSLSHQTELFKAHKHKCALGKVLLWLYDRCEGFLRGLLKWFLSSLSSPTTESIRFYPIAEPLTWSYYGTNYATLWWFVYLGISPLVSFWSQDHVSLMASALVLKPIV